MAIFGQSKAGPFMDRMSFMEESVQVEQTSNSLRREERLRCLEEAIKSRNKTIEEHEMDFFGEIQEGPLEERWRKLQEW